MDAADRLELYSLVEDPVRWEAMIRREIELARTDPTARTVIESIYCDEDREAAFERFRTGLELARIVGLFRRFHVALDARICEIGGGGGWLGWALSREGYRGVEMLEPNSAFISGTGYLRTRPDAAGIRIWNDLDAFYGDPTRYDLVLTHNCVHHFRGLAYVAACIRQKIAPGGRWIMIREPYAETAEALYRTLETHPYSQKYGIYEFAAPASHYVESMDLAGFSLDAVVPAGYANGALDHYVLDEGAPGNRAKTRIVDGLLAVAPGASGAALPGRALREPVPRAEAPLLHAPAGDALPPARAAVKGDAARPQGQAQGQAQVGVERAGP